MTTGPDLDVMLREGYGFDDEAVILDRALDPALENALNDHLVQVPLRQLDEHDLVAGRQRSWSCSHKGGDDFFGEPEVGDPDRPKLVSFFDETHLLFDGASKTLRSSIELTVRMIRSKGVGVFFVTQQPVTFPRRCSPSSATASSTLCAPTPRPSLARIGECVARSTERPVTGCRRGRFR